ncbi:MAG TPA: enoyl-CoA hydratase-related protein [Gammaproteobacteria bacterium]|nr:enoyl-CoA hydratase-related protein [Gammaproteobacteria bacterium]
MFGEYREIRFDADGDGIARLTLARPRRLNAYTSVMCRELLDAIGRYRAEDALRALLVTGEGRAFCSGGDVSGADPEHEAVVRSQLGHAREMRDGMHRVILALHALDKPVIALVNGPAVAGGLALALACDLRVAARSARLGDTSGRVGLLPDEGGAWLFPRFMGLDHALKMTMLGEVYDAGQARELGLVTEVVADTELEGRGRELARSVAGRAPLAVRLAKNMMRRGLDLTLEQSLGDAALSVMIANDSDDVREGVSAFLEKRQPRFRGK